MKKSITVYCFYIVIASLQAQNPSRFPLKPTSEWRVNYEVMDTDTTHISGDEIYKVFIDNDTIINELTYYKLFKTGIAYYDTIYQFNRIYVGAIRDDNNRFFFIKKNTSTEEMLYDFDLKTGDTIKTTIEKDMAVTSVDTLADGRKKINIRKTNFRHGECINWNNTYLIEGIGSMGGIFYESPCNHVGFRENYLICYYENKNLIYKNSLSPIDCATSTAISYSSDDMSGINIYPVPAEEQLIIENIKSINTIVSIEIYNLQGIKRLSTKVDNLSKVKTVKIDISEFKTGFYILKINTGLTSFIRKIVKE